MSIMLPQMMTRKPAPADSAASVTVSVQPFGAPNIFGLSEIEACVFAMQIGRLP